MLNLTYLDAPHTDFTLAVPPRIWSSSRSTKIYVVLSLNIIYYWQRELQEGFKAKPRYDHSHRNMQSEAQAKEQWKGTTTPLCLFIQIELQSVSAEEEGNLTLFSIQKWATCYRLLRGNRTLTSSSGIHWTRFWFSDSEGPQMLFACSLMKFLQKLYVKCPSLHR